MIERRPACRQAGSVRTSFTRNVVLLNAVLLNAVLLNALLIPLHAAVSNVFIAQSQAGAADGSSCANAKAVSFFNASGNWGAGAGQIGPGTTVHLCGTFTGAAGSTMLLFQGSGTSGNPITILFEPGAQLNAPYWAADGGSVGCGGAICMFGRSFITVDGGTNGIIQNTANGDALANNKPSTGIDGYQCSNCTVKNISILNLAVKSTSANSTPGDQIHTITMSGSHWLVHDTVMHDCGWCVFENFANGDTDIDIYNNDIDHMDHGWMLATAGANAITGPIKFHDNTIHDPSNWDTAACDYHHDGVHAFGVPGSSIDGLSMYNNYFYGNWGVCPTGFIYLENGSSNPSHLHNFSVWNNVGIVGAGSGLNTNGWFGLFSGESGSQKVYGNTLIGPNNTDNTICYSIQSMSGLTFENNAVSNCGDPVGISNSVVTAADYNFYGTSCGNGNNCFVHNNSFTGSFTNWKASTGFDTHSVQSNAPLLNAIGTPQAGSPAVGIGLNLTSQATGALSTLASDTSLGHTRTPITRPVTGAWDAGAYQFGSGAAGPAAKVYIAQTQAGTGDGSTCANAKTVSFFNTSGNWGAGAGQIGPGTTVHLCGTITSQLVGQGSGSSGSPITILFEPGAKISVPVCPNNGCVALNGLHDIVMDGGATVPCGFVNRADVTCNNGVIENTANGTGLANHLPSQAIYATPCDRCEFKNLMIRNLYVRTSTTDLGVTDNSSIRCITLTGSNSSIHNNTMHDAGWCLIDSYAQGDTNASVYNNELYNIGHGYVLSAGAFSGTSGPFFVHDNHIHGFAVWNDTTGNNDFHQDGIHCFSQNASGNPLSGFYMYNNVFGGPAGASINGYVYIEGSTGPPCASATSDIVLFNNVFLMDHFSTAGHLSLFSGRPTVYNNTLLSTDNNSGGTCLTTSGNYGGIGVAKNANNAIGGCFILSSYTPGSWAAGSPDYNAYGYVNSASDFYCGGQTNFSGWKSCAGNETHSTVQGSLNIDSTTGLPAAGSPVLAAGSNLSSQCTGNLVALCQDALGNSRPASGPWDIGAYQFSGASFSACDINHDNATNVSDVQLEVNMALGIASCANPSGQCTVTQVQRVVNAALGGQCVSP